MTSTISTTETITTTSEKGVEAKKASRPVSPLADLFSGERAPREQAIYAAQYAENELFGAMERVFAVR